MGGALRVSFDPIFFYPPAWQKMSGPLEFNTNNVVNFIQNITSWGGIEEMGGEMYYLILDFYIFYKHLALEGISGAAAGNFYLSILGKQNWGSISPRIYVRKSQERKRFWKKPGNQNFIKKVPIFWSHRTKCHWK